MCGIVGKLAFNGHVDQHLIYRMCAALEHRGPDSRGVHFEPGVGLGMQRLSIIDVSGGDQPIFNEDETVAVVMNGEIYNYVELRHELIGRGHRFTTKSDTEVLVHLYEEHGAEAAAHLRGMFAFAIWDTRTRRLTLGRDRVGKKPLFWARKGNCVWFGSELRALLADPDLDRSIDPQAISAYLALQYVPHPLSAFHGIRKLPPATTLIIDEAGQTSQTYWELDYSTKVEQSDTAELEDRLRHELLEATRIRLMSEVPLGAFLSGGVDSSAVVWAMAEQSASAVKTFSIGFTEADHDELDYARVVASHFGTDHHEHVVSPDALAIMPKLARHYGEPFADPSAIPSFYLAEMTGRHVTVALNGDGGDEAFAGYARYVIDHRVPRQVRGTPHAVQTILSAGRFLPEGRNSDGLRSKANKLGRLLAMSPVQRYSLRMSMFDGHRQRRLLSPDFAAAVGSALPDRSITDAWQNSNANNLTDSLLALDTQTYLPGDLLVKIDIATMAYSLEARSPFLDHQLLEFAASLPPELKLAGADGKHILKSALRGRVPDVILDREKMGFGVPLVHWFRNELRDLPAQILLDPQTVARGYFQRSEIERLIQEHREGRVDHGTRLWTLLQLEYWHREVVESPSRYSEALVQA